MKPSNYDKLKLKVDDVAKVTGRDTYLCYCLTSEITEQQEESYILKEVHLDEVLNLISHDFNEESIDNDFKHLGAWTHTYFERVINLQESRTETIPVYDDCSLNDIFKRLSDKIEATTRELKNFISNEKYKGIL